MSRIALKQPWVSIDNDSQGTAPDGILGEEHPHPRAYGTFPRILSKYVREEKLLTLQDAIRKFSALPAQRMRLADRGVLKDGMWADIVIFDPKTIHDVATFENPNQLSVGMEYVLVNGVPVIYEGKDDQCATRKNFARCGGRRRSMIFERVPATSGVRSGFHLDSCRAARRRTVAPRCVLLIWPN